MQDLLGERAVGLADLWPAWEAVRPVLFQDGTSQERLTER
jgi:hypothetical protein